MEFHMTTERPEPIRVIGDIKQEVLIKLISSGQNRRLISYCQNKIKGQPRWMA